MATQDTFNFDSYRLDVANQQLWHGAEPVSLRPKTFAVLRYLVEHAGRLVTRDELIAAVWPNTCGAEKAPKRCVLELRAALADNAHAPEIIATVGRLGYRFLAQISAEPPPPACCGDHAQPARVALVGRERELEQMHQWLGAAADGERQAVFISGEPGIGKTSLVETFLRQLRGGRQPRDARVGRGQCVEQYGEGEAYLPVLQALGNLAGEADDGGAVDVLRRHAPSWLAQFPALIQPDEAQELQLRLRATTPRRMLREITDAIRVLAADVPLILVLEDLHWSDFSTIDFVAAIAQGQDRARLMLIATYRSADVESGHPLRSVGQELLAHGRAHELPLGGLTPAAVARYLDNRFERHAFDPGFSSLLHRRTEGNPLFLVNLTDDLVAEELLAHTGDGWRLHAGADDIAARIPENSRRLIERQMVRLDAETQRLLEAASVAGFEFSAAAVGAALDVDPESVEERCDELARRELFVDDEGLDEWPDGAQSTRYGFRHALYQQLWSERVPTQRRQRFHLRIGDCLEQAYGGRAGDIAGELAVHFDRGRDFHRAVIYRCRAAENATQRSAHPEAIDHLTKALAALAHLDDTPERADRELTLQIALSVPLTATLGYAAPEVARTYTRALELSQQVPDTLQTVQVLLGLWVFYCARADLRQAGELADRCMRQTRRLKSPELLLDSHNAAGGTALWLGEFSAARKHLEQSVALHHPAGHRVHVAHDVTDPGVASLSHLSWALWFLGHADQAVQRSAEAIARASELDHPYSLAYALDFAAALHGFCRDRESARDRAEASMALAHEHGFPMWLAMGAVLHGWALAEQQGDAAAMQIRQGMDAFEAIGLRIGRPPFLGLLAETLAEGGRVDEGLEVLGTAAATIQESGERLYEAEMHRLRGELVLRKYGWGSATRIPQAVLREVEACFRQAIAVARHQQARSWELRAAVSLARLWRAQRRADAHALLSEAYSWFTEGFDTPDLKQASQLLGELAALREIVSPQRRRGAEV